MSLAVDGVSLVNVGGGVALAALGAWVARSPRTNAARSALAAYALALGLAMVAANLRSPDTRWVNLTTVTLTAIGVLVSAGAVVWLARSHLRAWPPRGVLAWAAGLGLSTTLAVSTVATLNLDPTSRAITWGFDPADPGSHSALLAFGTIAFFLFLCVAWLALFFLVADVLARPDAPVDDVRRAALLSAGLAIFPAANSGTYWPFPPAIVAAVGQAQLDLFLASHLVPTLVLSVLWLRVAGRTGAPRAARNLALLLPAAAFAGMLLSWQGGAGALGTWGLARLAGAAILAYAILRHQLLGIDVRLRWVISRSTVAAVFIAVFFVASEAAQQLFATALGSAYVGIVAAGALVFALAPLQRAADRLAAHALPTAPAAGALDERARREGLYRDAVRLALKDRVLTREEELTLARLAEEMRIGAGRALELRHEAEASQTADPTDP